MSEGDYCVLFYPAHPDAAVLSEPPPAGHPYTRCAVLPRRAKANNAAYDLCAGESAVVPAHGRALVPTGLRIVLCAGAQPFHPQICPRSGLAANHCVDVGAGIVDPGYTGEIQVLLINHGHGDFRVAAGDRIAQIRYVPVVHPAQYFTQTEGAATDRGSAGFGSTGRHALGSDAQ